MPLRYLSILLITVVFVGCQSPNPQAIPQMEFEELEVLLSKQNDTVYIINFWATWCKPCIEELPDFEDINEQFKDQPVKVLLVSLDFPGKYKEQLIPFVESRNIQSDVIHLNDVNANSWIDKVNSDWTGAIPATLIFKNDYREFFERKMSYTELKTIIEQNL